MADTHDESDALLGDEEWVAEALSGAVFPLPRKHVLWVAAENGVTPSQATALHQLPERLYADAQDVMEALRTRVPAEQGASEPSEGDQPPER